MLDTHRRNHDKLVAQTCANQLKVQTKKDVLSLSVRARSLPSFEGMDTENRLLGTFSGQLAKEHAREFGSPIDS